MSPRRALAGLGVLLLVAALVASRRLPPSRAVDAMEVVDLGARAPSGLRWTVGPGLGLAYHVRGAGDRWDALPLAVAGVGADLPDLPLAAGEVRPVGRGRVAPPAEESVWLGSSGRWVGVATATPGGDLSFALNDGARRLSGRRPLASCVGAR